MSDPEVKIPRWILVLVVSAVLGIIGYLVKHVWEQHVSDYHETDRKVDTLIREF